MTISALSAAVWAEEAAPKAPIVVEAMGRDTGAAFRPFETHTLAHLVGFDAGGADNPERNAYGGRTDRRAEAAGFFRTRKIDGRWWLVDPEGCLWYGTGLCQVRLELLSPLYVKAFEAKYESYMDWANEQNVFLRSLGFNCATHWQYRDQLLRFARSEKRLPYIAAMSITTHFILHIGEEELYGKGKYRDGILPVLHPEFESFAHDYARRWFEEQQTPELRNDPYMIGITTDNELGWHPEALDFFLTKLPPGDPSRAVVEAWLDKNGIEKRSGFTDEERYRFGLFYAGTYYRIAAEAVRHYDPNHLFLGTRNNNLRLHQRWIYEAMGPHVDVATINHYWDWDADPLKYKLWTDIMGDKPVFVTEWYAKGEDSGLRNEGGAGWRVKTQKDRGRFYQHFTLGLLQNPGVVGWHWFRYQDDNVGDPKKNSNKGIVTYDFEVYEDLVAMMKELNGNLYALVDYFEEDAHLIEKRIAWIRNRTFDRVLPVGARNATGILLFQGDESVAAMRYGALAKRSDGFRVHVGEGSVLKRMNADGSVEPVAAEDGWFVIDSETETLGWLVEGPHAAFEIGADQ
ncbi:MAG: hypothetical protein JXB13_16950 [Phycisphaerae bacterium]|nr:hypothetical protein [Phycisphaerae bacterium]